VERWTETYGQESTQKICSYDQAAPATAIRIGFGASGQRNIAEAKGKQFAPGRLLAHAEIASGDVTRSAAFREHRLMIQDEASQLVALLVGEGKNILDCCAAPGGKTRIIAQQNPDATVVALDLHQHRAALMRRLVTEANLRIMAGDIRQTPFSKEFDRILVDAPCSGTGTIARNPEIKWRLKLEDVARLQQYQVEILTSAMKHVAAGGRLVYSTCSLEPEENQQVVERVLAGDVRFRVLDGKDELRKLQQSGELTWSDLDSLLTGPYLRTLPGVHPCDGFFAAVLQKD
jgi:16S rRNA (cytosine967-C5)-methyltransferase